MLGVVFVIMGFATIGGRQVAVYAMDFTVMSGSLGNQGVWKIAELVQMAGQEQVPLIGILDSAGSRIDIEWGKVMAFLYEYGYDGYLSIEPHGPKWSRPPLREKMLLLTQRYIGQFLV